MPPLRRDDLAADPIAQLADWYQRALDEVPLADAMALATVDGEGRPDARMVLLKGFGDDGLRFFTNYESAKAGQLEAAGHAAELADRVARRARRAGGRARRALRRRRGATPRALGRVRAASRDRRVLARPGRAPSRPLPLLARGPGLAHRA